MRHFTEELKSKGYNLLYTKLDSPGNAGSFRGEVGRVLDQHSPGKIVVTLPGEYRVHQDILSWEKEFNFPVKLRQDDRFLCTQERFQEWAQDRKNLRMEFFYRAMRRKHGFLMDGDKPEGGQWNFDGQNQKSLEGFVCSEKSDDNKW